MRVLIAPDSFKGSLSAPQAAECMARGVLAVFPDAECDLAPIADGGEGTVDALVAATQGELVSCRVCDPLGREISASFGILGGARRAAVVEMAAASGLPLLMAGGLSSSELTVGEPVRSKDERNPRLADTYGTGQLIREALLRLHGANNRTTVTNEAGERPLLIIGIGGSATNDGGAGAMRALGARFLDAHGSELAPGGAALAALARVDLSGLEPLLAATEIRVACDVDNPLLGERGASAVFGPQKGATPEMVRELDAALARYAEIAAESTGRDVAAVPGAGAAGGLGAGLMFFTGARLEPGVRIVLDAVNLAERAGKADVVLTGEGRSDVQTAYGKAPVGVARVAKGFGLPVFCISGGLGSGVEAVHAEGIHAVLGSVSAVCTLEECMANAAPALEQTVTNAFRILRAGMELAAKQTK